MSEQKRATEGSVITELIEGRIILTTYRGFITLETLAQVQRDVAALLQANPGADWLVDTSAATGIAPARHDDRMAIFDTFRRHGGRRIATVVRAAPMRLIAATLAFAFGIPVKMFESRQEALKYLSR